MIVKNLINMLEKHNYNSEIKIILKKDCSWITLSSTANCRCKEKEVFLTIGTKYLKEK